MTFDLYSRNFITRMALPADLSPSWMLTYLSAPLGGEFYAELRCRPDEAEPALLAACGVGERPTLRQYLPDPHERQRLLKAMAAEETGHRILHLVPQSTRQGVASGGMAASLSRHTAALFEFVEHDVITPFALRSVLDCSADKAERVLRAWVREGLAEADNGPFDCYRPRMECRLGGYELWKRESASFPWAKAADILLPAPPHYCRNFAYVAEEQEYVEGVCAVVECLEGKRPAEPTPAMYPLVPSLFLIQRGEPVPGEIPF